MARMASKRFTFFLAMAVTMTLSGCVVEGGGGHGHVDPPPPPVPSYPGCPALLGGGNSGVISLSDWRGDYASLESYIAPDFFIRHYNGQGEASLIYSERDMDDATFRIVPGLADDRCISFEASNYPRHFLRHRGSDIFLDPDNNTLGFSEDATFCPRPGLAASNELSFESCNAPDSYLNIDDYDGRTYGLYLDNEYSAAFEEDATFLILPPW
ncbi:arabinofuranosidase [Cystobacter fuscus DSM 2262]|uniref:Arabinofuranosidase n=1 Tax=Cystobacter fuscus (strain ATCC 25194 / DSM 2262 / NBRC 100088 / M29) TaxID=1242864 RepID=S9QT32_CYSF2|nr:AbfB domain-containing protein [Cystobacter fuscus]EPX59803.1 arabinofuranosidase [Cystobacter fuscus DSM 2262]